MILPCAASDRADGPDRVPAALAFSGTDAGIQQPVVEGEEQPGVLIHGVGVAAGHPLGELVPMPRWGHRARAVLPVEEVVTAGTVGGLPCAAPERSLLEDCVWGTGRAGVDGHPGVCGGPRLDGCPDAYALRPQHGPPLAWGSSRRECDRCLSDPEWGGQVMSRRRKVATAATTKVSVWHATRVAAPRVERST